MEIKLKSVDYCGKQKAKVLNSDGRIGISGIGGDYVPEYQYSSEHQFREVEQ